MEVITIDKRKAIHLLSERPIDILNPIFRESFGEDFIPLSEMHNEWIHSMVFNPKNETLLAHRNSFKCFGKDTMVMMSNGSSKKIQDIQIGEYVMGWDSTPRKVINAYSNIDEMYKVTLTKTGESYTCNKNHILTLKQRDFDNKTLSVVDKYRLPTNPNIINIPIEEFINSPVNRRVTKGSTETFFKHFKVGVEFPDIKLWKSPYSVGSSIAKITDKDVQNKVKKFIPRVFLINSREKRLELLAGLIDTGGGFINNRYRVVCTCDNLTKDVEFLGRSLGFYTKIKNEYRTYTISGVKKRKSVNVVYISGEKICDIPVRKTKKNKRPREKKDYGVMSYSQTIEPIGRDVFYGITIEGDGMFLLDNFLVVHNTTCVSAAISIIMILFPNESILFVRGSDEAAKEIISQVTNFLSHKLFQSIAKTIHGQDMVFTRSNALSLQTNYCTRITGAPQLLGKGRASLTGLHFKRIFFDDLSSREDRYSSAIREQSKAVLRELYRVAGHGVVKGSITVWHADCLHTITENNKFFDVYSTGIFSEEDIEEIKKRETPSEFAANYLLKIAVDSELYFATRRPTTNDPTLLMGGACHIDAGFGGDATAASIVKKGTEPFVYTDYKGEEITIDKPIFVYGKRYKEHVLKVLDRILYIHSNFKCKPIMTELNADKGLLAAAIREKGSLAAEPYPENINKIKKIESVLYPLWKDIVFYSETDKDYIGEIQDWTADGSKYDDCIDSLASCLLRMKKQSGSINTMGYGKALF